MTGRWFFRKSQAEKAIKFGLTRATNAGALYAAPGPTRRLPDHPRVGWVTGERGKERIRLGRHHLLARPVKGSARKTQAVVAQLLPSVALKSGESALVTFESATADIPVAPNELFLGQSAVRRVRIEDTGVIALERTRCTQNIAGVRVVTLYWAIHIVRDRTLQMARICAEGETELRTYRTQVADFLRRWTASASFVNSDNSLLFR